MSRERTAMLAAILAHREDDTPRLVMADWLEENGEGERSEFIRVQCELARLPSKRFKVSGGPKQQGGPDYFVDTDYGYPADGERVDVKPYLGGRKYGPMMHGLLVVKRINSTEVALKRDALSVPDNSKSLRRRERELLSEHGKAWMPWHDLNVFFEEDILWSRGFITSITCDWQTWLTHSPALFWNPGASDECPKCHGDGKYRGKRGWAEGLCKGDCKATGRIPRPCPASAMPLERLVLTDWPQRQSLAPASGPPMMEFTTVEGCRIIRERCPSGAGVSDPLNLWTCDRWPGLSIELPQAERTDRQEVTSTCGSCGDPGATFGPDPYAYEINDDDTPVWMCSGCRHERAMDI